MAIGDTLRRLTDLVSCVLEPSHAGVRTVNGCEATARSLHWCPDCRQRLEGRPAEPNTTPLALAIHLAMVSARRDTDRTHPGKLEFQAFCR